MSSTSPSSGGGASDSGHTIGPYVLTKEIGKGSFAVVFQAKLRSSEPKGSSPSKVAIKIVTRRKLTQKLLENLEGEINILRTVRHVNIVELINCLKTNSHIYLVMQYCRMGDLSNYIKTRRRGTDKDKERRSDLKEIEADAVYPHPHDGGLNSAVVRSFLSQLAAALQFMRARNIVHRDIKPQVSSLLDVEER
jgi:serine/threonine-protein kinase ULK/ATG1